MPRSVSTGDQDAVVGQVRLTPVQSCVNDAKTTAEHLQEWLVIYSVKCSAEIKQD